MYKMYLDLRTRIESINAASQGIKCISIFGSIYGIVYSVIASRVSRENNEATGARSNAGSSRRIRPHHAHKHHIAALDVALQHEAAASIACERHNLVGVGRALVEVFDWNLRTFVRGQSCGKKY